MKCEYFCSFCIGLLIGAGTVLALNSEIGKKACVGILSKGMELKDRAETLVERTKENVADVVAEAKYVTEQKQNPAAN